MYYVKISENTSGGYNLANDPFTVTLAFDTTDVCECNNTFEAACPIPVNTTFEAKLWGINKLISDNTTYDRDEDQDFYKVTPTQCGVIDITITNINNSQSLTIEVFDSTYTLVSTTSAYNGANASLSTLLSANLHYIRISEHASGGYNLADDPFSVTLSYTPKAVITSVNGDFCQGGSLNFVSSAVGVTSWFWDFGANATPTTSSLQSPGGIVFNTVGTHYVTLTANGCAVDTQEVVIQNLYPTPIVTQTGSVLSTTASGGTLQWYLNGNALPGMTGTSLTITQQGEYKVCVKSASNSCITCSQIIQIGVAVEPTQSQSLQVYPNPTTGLLTVGIPALPGAALRLYDALGREHFVPQTRTSADQLQLDLSALPAGVYLLRAGAQSARVVKE